MDPSRSARKNAPATDVVLGEGRDTIHIPPQSRGPVHRHRQSMVQLHNHGDMVAEPLVRDELDAFAGSQPGTD